MEEPDVEESDSECALDFRLLPNYEEIKHFEEPLTDEEFMIVIVDRLNNFECEVTYKAFKQEFLPRHRKPLFKDYARFRMLETVLLEDE